MGEGGPSEMACQWRPVFRSLLAYTVCVAAMKNQKTNSHRGLLAGGNWIIDQVKIIDVYPQPEQLGNIRRQSQGTGGAPYNVLIALAKSGVSFPLYGAGLVGKDALGEQILDNCRQCKIDLRYIGVTRKAPTS